jgi:purine-binding chemotaxis protein CheW
MSHAIRTTPAQSGPAPAGFASDPPHSFLRLAMGDEVVAVGIEDVREILQVTRLTPLPRTPEFVRGVMNLRGAVVPVVDLAARLGRPATVIGRRSCIVVVSCHAEALGHDEHDAGSAPSWVLGLLVDAVFEVFDRRTDEIESAPPLGTRIAPDYLRGVTRAGGTLIGVLSLPRLLSVSELADSIAGHLPH